MSENKIILKTITELLGLNFYIPDYQRGYRWTKYNVTQLLDDIWEYRQNKENANTFYCLQPVVVRKKSWVNSSGENVQGFELIDGQQRLTTLHRILHFLTHEHLRMEDLSEEYPASVYSIEYETRPETRTFLNSSNEDHTKPDLYYLSQAYLTIKNWFQNEETGLGRADKNKFVDTILPSLSKDSSEIPEWSVQVIWYEINDENQKSENLFTRLNRGKIPLTSAELIKAKFVNRDSFKEVDDAEKIKRRTQLIQIWDEIENQLNNPKFWAFISNYPIDKYSSKIEYLFDVASGKKKNEKDKLFSFINFFKGDETGEELWNKWISIEEIYRSLCFWFSDKHMYHKVGYLITIGISIQRLIQLKRDRTKSEFEQNLNLLIAQSIPEDWEELSYASKNDSDKIFKVLLLVNIELTRKNNNSNDFFPFEVYKNLSKSLEHVHAQNILSIDSNKKDQWFSWLQSHTSILLQVATNKEQAEKLIGESEELMAEPKKFQYVHFQELSEKILKLIPKEEGVNEHEYLHNISNLAILGMAENTSLSNAVFEVKRRKIIEMDKAGSFIPIATKRIFLNYYQSESFSQSSIWTKKERDNYMLEISTCLEEYTVLNQKENED